MLKEDKFIPTFSSFGWNIEEENFAKVRRVLADLRHNRANKSIPIFSIIDSVDDLDEIIDNSKFFTNAKDKTEEFILIGTGGSSLGAEAFIEAIEVDKKYNFHVLDNINSSDLTILLKKINS